MKIRFANENDKAGIYKTMGYCFNTPYNSIKNNIENGSFAKNEKFVVAVDDNNDIKSLFAIIDYNTYFEGKIAKMAGIAGVSSLPENRGEGNIEDLFKFALKYMNDNDFIFSALGPFAFQYYRKFGYEWCYTWQLVSIPIEDLKNFKKYSKSSNILSSSLLLLHFELTSNFFTISCPFSFENSYT